MAYEHCDGDHKLQALISSGGGAPGVLNVVRWCSNCGAVSIDTDVDGRTIPGDVRPMQFPKIAQAYVEKEL